MGSEIVIPDLDDMFFDISLLSTPIVSDFVAFEFNGTFYSNKNPEPHQIANVSIPYRDMTGKAF
jgi:hypothetical protein